MQVTRFQTVSLEHTEQKKKISYQNQKTRAVCHTGHFGHISLDSFPGQALPGWTHTTETRILLLLPHLGTLAGQARC